MIDNQDLFFAPFLSLALKSPAELGTWSPVEHFAPLIDELQPIDVLVVLYPEARFLAAAEAPP